MSFVQAGSAYRVRKALAGVIVNEQILGLDLHAVGGANKVKDLVYGSSFAEFLELNRDTIQLYEPEENLCRLLN
jgi:hypothetical protein